MEPARPYHFSVSRVGLRGNLKSFYLHVDVPARSSQRDDLRTVIANQEKVNLPLQCVGSGSARVLLQSIDLALADDDVVHVLSREARRVIVDSIRQNAILRHLLDVVLGDDVACLQDVSDRGEELLIPNEDNGSECKLCRGRTGDGDLPLQSPLSVKQFDRSSLTLIVVVAQGDVDANVRDVSGHVGRNADRVERNLLHLNASTIRRRNCRTYLIRSRARTHSIAELSFLERGRACQTRTLGRHEVVCQSSSLDWEFQRLVF